MPAKDRSELMPALGFFGIGPWFTGDDVVFLEARANERDDKIDALTKGFLGLTVTCARCHNHKYDPISQKDYYALSGVFANSGFWEYNLAPEKEVEACQAQRKKVKAAENALQEYAEASAIRGGNLGQPDSGVHDGGPQNSAKQPQGRDGQSGRAGKARRGNLPAVVQISDYR